MNVVVHLHHRRSHVVSHLQRYSAPFSYHLHMQRHHEDMEQFHRKSHHMTQQRCYMRGIAKQDAIRRARLKFIKIVMFQDKALATKRPKMRNGWLASKVKLIGSQIQD
jgi:hypothetical protein